MSSDRRQSQGDERAAKRVTLADVARIAGVSQTAASFVLSGRRKEMRISEEVEARVLQAARDSGYRPNIVSRSLRTGTSNTIGFVSDTLATTPFAGHVFWGALDAARERGHLLFIGETEGDPDLETPADRGDARPRRRRNRPRLHVHTQDHRPQSAQVGTGRAPERAVDHSLIHPIGIAGRARSRKGRRPCPARGRPQRRHLPHRRRTAVESSPERQPRRRPAPSRNQRDIQSGRRRTRRSSRVP